MSGRGQIGNRTGGKGSWRRKGKKQPHGDNLEAQKVWAAARRLINNRIFQLDGAAILFDNQTDKAKAFTKPELLCDQRANTYILHGKAEDKPLTEVIQELLAGMDISKFAQNKEDKEDDLGEVPENLDFSKTEEQKEEEKPATTE